MPRCAGLPAPASGAGEGLAQVQTGSGTRIVGVTAFLLGSAGRSPDGWIRGQSKCHRRAAQLRKVRLHFPTSEGCPSSLDGEKATKRTLNTGRSDRNSSLDPQGPFPGMFSTSFCYFLSYLCFSDDEFKKKEKKKGKKVLVIVFPLSRNHVDLHERSVKELKTKDNGTWGAAHR